MAMIRRPLRRSAQALAVLVWVLAAPALACSRETFATVDPAALFATATETPMPASPTSSATAAAVETRASVPLPSVTPRPTNTFPHTPTLHPRATPLPMGYLSQAGDTLRTIAIRFGVVPSDIQAVSGESLPVDVLLEPGTQLIIPVSLTDMSDSTHLFPDSAIVYSPAFANFDPIEYVHAQGGYLSSYIQGGGDIANGAEILRQIAFNNSFSPKLLMALIEYESGWITQASPPSETLKYPLGNRDPNAMGLTAQLIWATNILSIGYYGWRDASVLELGFADGGRLRLAPDLNAGTVAILNYFSRTTSGIEEWQQAVEDFCGVYQRLFGNPFDEAVEPLYTSDLPLYEMELPFYKGQQWAYTGGPHGAWERDGARAALDFAPTDAPNCGVSPSWTTASAAGLIVRSIGHVVVIDLDGDGYEQTGWNILYLHIADKDHILNGTRVETDDRLGHPSCEGGIATGTHIHIARKYNGEWMLAGGPVPFVLSGWVAAAGEKPYEGTLERDGYVVIARAWATKELLVWR
ncbi:MAG: LysM peptidoglycan-binding domain-containing protein [Anaerolineales bacterium]|nr:LysM peptidoglycan-binding domain-containing protein [Anaerolineales bacterium]